MAQRFAHLGEKQFRFIAQTEKGFGASEFFAGACDREDFFGSHRMRAGFSGIAAESAIAAVVAAEVGQWEENLARVGDDAGLEVISCGAGGGEKRGQIVVTAVDQAQG